MNPLRHDLGQSTEYRHLDVGYEGEILTGSAARLPLTAKPTAIHFSRSILNILSIASSHALYD